jgi:hypothetical protein
MKNPEEAIEKVLSGLRNSDAPVGMERRILDTLQDQALAHPRSGWRKLTPNWLATSTRPVAAWSLAGGVALAGMFAIVLAIPAIHRHTPAQSKRNAIPAGSLPEATSEVVAKSAPPPSHRSSVRFVEQTNPSEKTRVRSGGLDSNQSVALDEMRAANHPAPPMPLTEQERLLLRIAHRGDPVELAMLDPMIRAARDAKEGAEFQQFFGPETIEPPTTGQPKAEQPATEQPTTGDKE